MIDRPLDQIFNKFRNSNEENKEFLKYIFEKSDSISLWVIGLSVAALPLLLTNIATIKKIDPTINLRCIVISLCISIISGIIYRGAFLYWYTLQIRLSEQIGMAFTIEKGMHLTSRLTGTENFQELTMLVQDTTGSDYTSIIDLYNQSEDVIKQIMYNDLIKFYLATVDFAKKDADLALDAALGIYAKAAHTTKEAFKKKAIEINFGFRAKWAAYIMRTFYISFMISFFIALCFLAYAIK